MRYKTLKDFMKPFASGFLCLWVLGVFAAVYDRYVHEESLGVTFFTTILLTILFILIFFIYCFSGDWIRKKYRKGGLRLEGYVESAEESFCGRGENRYRLKIAFQDNGKQIRWTEWYIGDPNQKLKSRKCSVYKRNGKYREADFDVRGKKEAVYNLNIPISQRK